MANRLAHEQSPYLLQHADNPVEWWPWTDEAFAEARRRNVPVLLSVGYAACHWCHVMAHESFSDAATAAVMNAGFVCVKVDREERPDVDAVYMEATQAMTGQGGWPMTAFLTPSGEPFFCGTYFPPARRGGMPAFVEVLNSVTNAWRERQDEIETAGKEIVRQLAEAVRRPAGEAMDGPLLDRAFTSVRASYDGVFGGLGGAPKFPPSMLLEFLLRHAARTADADALRMVEHTTERMARGGIYDQLGGGFARYSVDRSWVVPHFEKMLYDNALLARVYLHLWRATGSELALRVARETCAWMLRDLRTAEGGFASALDADSEGEEGRYYVWTPDELVEVLGQADGGAAAEIFRVTPDGTFEHGTSVLQLQADPADPQRFARIRTGLLAARDGRVPPARDDKVVAAWNGLAIAALAEAGTLLDAPDLLDAALGCARLLERLHLADGRLLRTSLAGVPGRNAGVLEDYGDVAEGFLALHQATGDPHWAASARRLVQVALDHFADGAGGFHDTADDAEHLVRRPRDATDNATPSGTSAVAGALVTCSALLDEPHLREAAERALAEVAGIAAEHARFAGWALAVGEALEAGPLQVAVVDRPDLATLARLSTSPGAVVVAGDGDAPGVPLLAGRSRPAAYVCRGFVCDAPTDDASTLARQVLAGAAAHY